MSQSIHLPVEQVAKVVKRHLVTQRDSVASENGEASQVDQPHSSEQSSDQNKDSDARSIHSTIRSAYKLPGGSIVDGIYKWTANVESERKQRLQRSQSISFPLPLHRDTEGLSQRLKQPGGFRRHYVLSKAAKQGRKPPNLWTNSFAEFLCLYGHFGGEDLSDDDDLDSDSDEDEEAIIGYGSSVLNDATAISSKPVVSKSHTRSTDHDRQAIASTSRRRSSETTPLLSKPNKNTTAVQGTATPAKAVFLLLKSFVTTGMYLSFELSGN
jgi:proton-coupled amino acid transporter